MDNQYPGPPSAPLRHRRIRGLEASAAAALRQAEAAQKEAERLQQAASCRDRMLDSYERLDHFPDVFKLGGPRSMLLDLVQMTCSSCLNVRVCKKRRRTYKHTCMHACMHTYTRTCVCTGFIGTDTDTDVDVDVAEDACMSYNVMEFNAV